MSTLTLNTDIHSYVDAGMTGDVYYPLVEHYYPNYIIGWSNGDKAFKVAQMLVNKKLVKVATVKQFIELVNSLIDIL